MFQFLHLAMIKIQEQQGRNTIIDTLYANFQEKQTTLTFSVQICPKMDLGLEIEKTNVRIKINILKILCVPIFSRNRQL